MCIRDRSYDESLFEQKTASLKCMQDNVEPVDAYIKEIDDGFEVVPEIEGTKIDRDKLMEDIKNAVTTGRTVANLEEDGCYINPTVYTDDLTKDCQQMNELTDVVEMCIRDRYGNRPMTNLEFFQ